MSTAFPSRSSITSTRTWSADPEPADNRTPLLINRAGEFRQRPGKPDEYHVNDGRIVFAGNYMQTYTRLTTMESANESARHAVNAILEDAGFDGDPCMIAPPELHEFQDLRWLVELDERLWELGLPHALDIVDAERVFALLYDPYELRRMVREAIRRWRGGGGNGIRLTV